MTDTVTIRRELLERHLNSNCHERLCLGEFRKTSEELRAALAAPRQPVGLDSMTGPSSPPM